MLFSGEENRVSGVDSEKDRIAERKLEKKLVEAVQNGDSAAYGKLIRQHQKRLMRFVIGLVGSFDQAEDIVQEAFVKGYQAIGRFDTRYAFYPWLSTIARNLAFNQMRREERKDSLDSLQEKGYDPATQDLGPLENLLDGESQKRFYKAVMALPEKYRVVFVLRQFEQMSYHDIGTQLKIPAGTVDSRLYRARTMLMENLKDLL